MGDDAKADLKAKLAERGKAEKLSPEEIKERNRIALEKRKAALAAKKQEEAQKELPAGWRRVESRSRPGEFVYENVHTEERQSWFPDAPAPEEAAAPLVAQTEGDAKKQALKEKNKAALEKRKAAAAAQREAEKKMELPDGWIRTTSRSRPGEVVYENTVTGERQAWFPDAPAGGAKPNADKVAKNKAALEAFRAKKAAEREAEAAKPLPDGWKRVESRSRPGEFVYENLYTEERQSWFPDAPAEKPLPEGWRKVESRSYPGEFVYENIHTMERQAWRPDEPPPAGFKEQTAAERTAEQLATIAKEEAAAEANIICMAKALYDYTAANPDEEVDLAEGDVVAVEYQADNGWWVGTNQRTGRSGIFPGTYVEELPK